jgi:opacity protein-like surface antigen
MKKSLFALGLLSGLLSAPVWAAGANQGGFSYSGAYGGLDLGFSSATDTVKTGSLSVDQGSTGFGYGGFVGYGMQFQGPWYLGGELGLGDTTGSTRTSLGSTYTKESQDYLFSADLRGGRVVGESTLAYAKLGWAHSDFDQKVVAGNTGFSNDSSYDGIRFGAGAETLLSGNFTGRLEAVYTDYGSQTVNNAKFAPTDVGVRFGVSYYFY